MSHLHGARSRLLLISTGCLLACLALLASTAHAEFGEETRFGPAGLKAGELTNKCSLEGIAHGGCARAIGVDPRDNSVYVLDEPKEEEETETESTRHFRLQKFKANAQGKYELAASASFIETSPPLDEEGAVEGIAFDESENRVYVLAVDVREKGRIDSIGMIPNNSRKLQVPVASTLYAFSTKESGTKLVGAGSSGPNKEILVDPEQLHAQSNTPGQALLEPRGITVDPKTNEVIILAHEDRTDPEGEIDDVGNPEDHYILQRVLPNGSLVTTRYVDTNNVLKDISQVELAPNSPIVVKSPEGTEHIYVQLPLSGIMQIPEEAGSTTEPSPLVQEPPTGVLSMEPLTLDGGGLSATPEGTIAGVAGIHNEVGEVTGEYFGLFDYSLSKSAFTWTGGQSPIVSITRREEDRCVLQPGVDEVALPLVAAGSGGKLFVLASEYLFIGKGHGEEEEEAAYEEPFEPAVLEFGPSAPEGDGGCPHASAGELVAERSTGPLKPGETVPSGANVTFSASIKQADALSVTWKFTNGTTTEEKVVPQDEFQATKLVHAFPQPGEWTITETVETDDLASPQLVATRKVTVAPNPPTAAIKTPSKIIAGEAATFSGEESKDTNGSPLEYAWSIDGGPVLQTGPSPLFKHTFASAAKEKITLTVTDTKFKLTGTLTREVTVESASSTPPPTTTTTPTTSGGSSGGSSGGGTGEVKGIVESQPVPPDAKVAGTSLTVSSSGALTVKVSCPAGATGCSGTVTLKTVSAVAAGHGKKKTVLTLAAGSFTLAGGQVKAVTLHLSAQGRALLGRSHALQARATVVAHSPAGASDTTQALVTLRPAPVKKGHGKKH